MNKDDALVSTTTWSGQGDTAVSRSNMISVHAPPFIPRCSMMNYCYDDDLRKSVVAPANSVLSPDAPEFYPRSFMPTNTQSCVDTGDLEALVDLSSMARSLDEFYSSLSSVVSLLASTDTSQANVISSLFDHIITQTLRDESLRSVGVQVCSQLSHQVSLVSVSFTQLLVNQCEQLISSTENTNIAQLVGISLFVAELLANMKGYVAEERLLSRLVLQILHLLLSQSHEQTLRCSVSILQINGAVLEKMSKDLDHICYTLEAYILDPAINFGLRQEMMSILELRANNWVGAANIESYPTTAVSQPYQSVNGTDNKAAEDVEPMNGSYTRQLEHEDEQDLCNQFSETTLLNSGIGYNRVTNDHSVDCVELADTFCDKSGNITASSISAVETCSPTPQYNNCWAYMP